MGLDTSHNCFHGSYGRFDDWRNAVATAAGYSLGVVGNQFLLPISHISEENALGIWDEPPSDALIVLLAHSDCDGVIKAEHCGPLADRIEALLPSMVEHHADTSRQFILGLRAAAAAGENVEFR